MSVSPPQPDGDLALVQGILHNAFFSPLFCYDLFGFRYGQPGLLGLEEDEAFDLFVRGAIIAETVQPELAEGRLPLAWLLSVDDPAPVLAHVLSNLANDRPLMFHRVLYSLPPVCEGRINPEEFELMEDFLQKALGEPLELATAGSAEAEGVRRRALMAAKLDPDNLPPEVEQIAADLLARPEAHAARTDEELVSWLTESGVLDEVDHGLAPGVLVESWSRWVSAVMGTRIDLELLTALMPQLGIGAAELAAYAPPGPGSGHLITAQCPYCQAQVRLRLTENIERQDKCPHLVFVGTGDEMHLMQVLRAFELGSDFIELMTSYYHSPGDLDLFAGIVNDLYEMISQQGRLSTRPIHCETSPHGFYYLKAYFSGPPEESQGVRH